MGLPSYQQVSGSNLRWGSRHRRIPSNTKFLKRSRMVRYTRSLYQTAISTDHAGAVDDFFGYGKLAAIQDCDPNFLQYRKFGWLRNNVLLVLQEELQELERDLEEYFQREWSRGNRQRLRSRDVDRENPKSEWMEKLTKVKAKLQEYGESFNIA